MAKRRSPSAPMSWSKKPTDPAVCYDHNQPSKTLPTYIAPYAPQTHFAGFFCFASSYSPFTVTPGNGPLAPPAHTCFHPSRAMLSPPRLPALCIVFHAVALGTKKPARTGGPLQKRDLLHHAFSCTISMHHKSLSLPALKRPLTTNPTKPTILIVLVPRRAMITSFSAAPSFFAT